MKTEVALCEGFEESTAMRDGERIGFGLRPQIAGAKSKCEAGSECAA